jgi:hypothetical protein
MLGKDELRAYADARSALAWLLHTVEEQQRRRKRWFP